MPPVRLLRRLTPVLALVMLAACGESTTGQQQWRGLEVELPGGWEVFERSSTLLGMADAPLGDEEGDRGDRAVAAQFTYEPGTSMDDWRTLIGDSGGDIETDRQITLDGVPAQQLTFNWVTNDVPIREMVVIVPSRDIVMLFQPVPVQGQTDAPEIFVEHADEFQAILDSIRFGAPVEDP